MALSCSDASLTLYTVDDPVPSKRFNLVVSWQAPCVQMSLAWMPTNEMLYSGGNDGAILAWDIKDKMPQLVATMAGHSDIVMYLLAIPDIDNLASASLDTNICLWDTYTHAKTMRLAGHRKGVFSLSYHPSFRLLISTGFEHDAFVWSPFTKALVYKLKGHHASLIGCQCVEGSDEVLTADSDGVFKLWDIRTFNCAQSFSSELTNMRSSKESAALNGFFHSRIAPVNEHQKEDDSRVFACSKMVICFDQERIVHEATSDFMPVNWVAWNEETSVFLTVSDKNLIVWDALLGCRNVSHSKFAAGKEITACCLDDRKRKIVIGMIGGQIDVYNPQNAQLMKSCVDDVGHAVINLAYDSENRRFVAGYANGLLRLYDESALEDCPLIRTFDEFHNHPELLNVVFCVQDSTLATAGSSSEFIKLWDYASGKMEVEIDACDEEEHLVAISYMTPLPYVMTADSRGNVYFWGSRGSGKLSGCRLSGFLNMPPPGSVRETFYHIHNPADRPVGRIYAYDAAVEEKYRNPNENEDERVERTRKAQQLFDRERQREELRTNLPVPKNSPGKFYNDGLSVNSDGSLKTGSSGISISSGLSSGQRRLSGFAGGKSHIQQSRERFLLTVQSLSHRAEDDAADIWGRCLAASHFAWHEENRYVYIYSYPYPNLTLSFCFLCFFSSSCLSIHSLFFCCACTSPSSSFLTSLSLSPSFFYL